MISKAIDSTKYHHAIEVCFFLFVEDDKYTNVLEFKVSSLISSRNSGMFAYVFISISFQVLNCRKQIIDNLYISKEIS